ncbi:MAG: DNA-formamidopyrimidine glycosylase [Candidatus Caenarcaniphilales bacterium]|nr:DNA-formamidopyrimidine glycosylase [Candidatus Caenarcaniphilales bacterium]
MPELPEVETIRRGLEARIKSRKILKVQVTRPRTLLGIDPKSFQSELLNQVFTSFERKAKYLFFIMQSGKVIVTHLRMSGSFRVQSLDTPNPSHTHMIFELNRAEKLLFQDLRGFGKISLYPNFDAALNHANVSRLAPEPLSDEFTLIYFQEGLAQYKTRLKPLLLDQYRVVSGLGNIYVDESLFHAGILPDRIANKLSKTEIKRLYLSIRKVIKDSIEAGGSSIRNYVRSDGDLGKYALNLFVYSRKRQNCRICETPIIYTRLAQRGTHYCPNCQV